MAIKGGQILHVGNGVAVIDRVQTAGPGQLNIPTEKIYELGNYKSVATVRDTPDLSFNLESLDVSTEIEALLTNLYGGRSVTAAASVANGSKNLTVTGGAFTAADVGRQVIIPGAGTGNGELVTTIDTVTDATTVVLVDAAAHGVTNVDVRIATAGIDLAKATPVDFASQFKAGINASDPFKVISSVALPFLYLEQMQYRFGLRDNASQQATLRGDTIFYSPGAAFVEKAAGTGAAGQTIATAHPAFESADGDARRVLAVTVGEKRLVLGADYTEAYGAVTGGAAITTITLREAVPADQSVRIVYASPDEVRYPQNVHPDTTVKPAAVKGRDIEIYVGGYDPSDRAGSQVNKLGSVQSAQVDWRVTLEKDEEFGNHYAVGQDFEVPDVSGSIDVKPRDNEQLFDLLRKISGVTDETKVIGPSTSVPLPLDIVIKHPDTGAVVKRLHVDDARFTVPGYSGQVQQKLTVSLPFSSDEGDLLIFER